MHKAHESDTWLRDGYKGQVVINACDWIFLVQNHAKLDRRVTGSLAAAGCEEGPAELGLISLGQAMESDCESELMVS